MLPCKAIQQSDQMVCECGNTWDMNDPHPPACIHNAGVIPREPIQPLLVPTPIYFSIVHYDGQPGWTVGPCGTDYQHVADQIRGWRNVTDALIYHVIPPTL